MKKTRKILSSILLIIILLQSLFIETLATDGISLKVASSSGYRGDTVEISVNISSFSNMQACGFSIEYDKTVLELVSAEKGDVINISPVINTNKLGKISYSYAATTPLAAAGSLLDLQFKIKSDAAYGQSDVTISLIEMSDGNFEAIDAACTNGYINVVAPKLNAPSQIEILSMTDSTVSLMWSGDEEATGYNLYLNGTLYNSEPLDENYYELSGLEFDTDYQVQITTLHYTTESDKSDILHLHTPNKKLQVMFVNWNYIASENDESTILKYEEVEYGNDAEPPETPTREGYRFVSWDKDFTNVTENIIVQAQYEPVVYTVTFVDWDGTVLDTQTVNYGGAATAPENPTREGYIFTIWDCAFDNVTSDLTVNAQYTEITCEHANTETINARESTCAEKGYAGDVYCNDCGLVVAIGGELDYAEHKYNSVITEPTPDSQGYTTYTCSVCGDSYVDNYTEYVDENAPQIVVASKKGVIGNTIDVTIALKNNPGIASATMQLAFDTDVLTLTKVVDAGNLGIQCHKPELTSPYTLAWMNDTATEDFTFNGTIVTLTFEIAEDAELGDYTIDLSYDYDNYDIWNVNVEKVEFAAVDGVITVIDTIIGDVNGDGAVNTLDRMALARYLANWEGYTAETIDLVAADVNGDGVINTLDRMALARHLANWSGYETLPCEI